MSFEADKQAITDAVLASPELAEFNTPSLWTRIGRFIEIVASYMQAVYGRIDQAKAEINAAIANRAVPTLSWFRAIMLEFQYSETVAYTLSVKLPTYAVEYDIVVPEDRIITRASARTTADNEVQIKVAQGTTTLSALTAPQVLLAEAYIQQRAPAGTDVQVISLPANEIIVTLAVTHQGSIAPAVMTSLVEAAITAYLTELSGIDFDGTFRRARIVQRVLAIEGVVDCTITRVQVDAIDIGDASILPAGYAVLATGSLTTSLTLIPVS